MAFDFVVLAGTLRLVAILLSTITIAFAGFSLATGRSPQAREEWKEVIAGVIIGLILLFLVPLIAAQLSGGSYCR